MASMNEIIGMMITLMTVVIVMYLGPGIGQQVSTALPINKTGDFANATTGASVWNSASSIIAVVILVGFVGVILRSLKGISGNGGNE